jgi:FAD/FMN-containing dehydrogenase
MLLKRATAALALWATAALAGGSSSPSASTKKACKKLQTAVPGLVSHPLTLDYHVETRSYWSTALWELKPSCLVLPRSAEDVAAAVRVLKGFPDVQFAVKSGGHDPNPRHASVKSGVLISMKDLTGTTYNEDKGLAYVKPGGEWNDVVGALEPYGVTVLGGRLGKFQVKRTNKFVVCLMV